MKVIGGEERLREISDGDESPIDESVLFYMKMFNLDVENAKIMKKKIDECWFKKTSDLKIVGYLDMIDYLDIYKPFPSIIQLKSRTLRTPQPIKIAEGSLFPDTDGIKVYQNEKWEPIK